MYNSVIHKRDGIMGDYEASTSEVDGALFGLEAAPLLLPHFTFAFCSSISKPFDHAAAAVSAEARSLKLTKAHLETMY